jgi:hypothetical protein
MLFKTERALKGAFVTPVREDPKMSWMASKLDATISSGPKSVTLHQRGLSEEAFRSLEGRNILGVDTETGGLDPTESKLHLVQIADIHGNVHVIQQPGSHSAMLKVLLFKRKNIVKVFHWAKFDIGFLVKGLYETPEPSDSWREDLKVTLDRLSYSPDISYGLKSFVCTKVITKLLAPGMAASLKRSVKYFLKRNMDKQVEHGQWDNKVLTERQLEYAANDVLVLIPLVAEQINQAQKYIDESLLRNLDNLAIRVQAHLVDMVLIQLNGFTDLFEHGTDFNRTLSPLLRRVEVKNELDDSRNDGNTGGPKAADS